MRKLLTIAGAALLLGPSPALAQKATEIHVPIGKSPGVSGRSTIIAHIQSVDPQKQSIQVTDGDRSWTVKLTEESKIWIDRHRLRKRNVKGSLKDCLPGHLVEVKYRGQLDAASLTCEWIKVAASADEYPSPATPPPGAAR